MKIDVGSRALIVEKEDGVVVVRFRKYPDYPHGNYVDDVIKIYSDKTAEMYRVRNGWNGSGRDDYGRITLTDSEYGLIMDAVNRVEKIEDFERAVEIFISMLSERIKEIDAMVEKLAKVLNRYRHAKSVFESLCADICRRVV